MTAQEIKYIDLSAVQQRTELRHPPASPATCEDGTSCVGGGSGGVSVVDGAPDQRDPHALGVYLMRVTPTDINPFEPFEAEFKVLNTGQVSLELPVSPYLSDLQPGDESLDFHYLSLSLVVVGEPEPGGPDVGGSRLHHAVRFTGLRWKCDSTASGRMDSCWTNMKVHTWPSEPVFAGLRGQLWLRRNVYHPQPGGGFTERENLYPKVTFTPSIAVDLLGSVRPEEPKQ